MFGTYREYWGFWLRGRSYMMSIFWPSFWPTYLPLSDFCKPTYLPTKILDVIYECPLMNCFYFLPYLLAFLTQSVLFFLIFRNTEIVANFSSTFSFRNLNFYFLIYLYLKSNCHSPVRCLSQKQRTVGVPSVLPSDPSGASQLS